MLKVKSICKIAVLTTFLLSCLASKAQTIDDEKPALPQPTKVEGSVPNNNDQDPNIDYGPYLVDLKRRIKNRWSVLKGYENNLVTVGFKVHKDGTISDLKLLRPSEYDISDLAALHAVQKSAPFRPLPKDETNESIDIEIFFDFNNTCGVKSHLFKPI